MLWFAQFTAIFGFSFAFPFLPLYIKSLGVADPHELALWTGAAGGASGFALALLSPVWGLLADRYGRKPMLIRAMVGGGVTVGLMAFARGPLDLVFLRLLQGAFSGTVAATTTLVATGTPRARVGWAMGILSSAVALGSAVGPFAGGLAAGRIGLRNTFLAGGLLLLLAVAPVILAVREAPFQRPARGSLGVLPSLRAAGGGSLAAIAVLLAAQTLLQLAFSGAQSVIPLKLIAIVPRDTATVTGLTFGVAGVASATAAVLYSRVAARTGYRRLAAATATLAAGALALLGVAPGVVLVILATTLTGFCFGTIGPATSAMIGLEAPVAVQGRIFGLSASATALGFALGPLLGGTMAGVVSVSAALLTTAGVALLLGVLLSAAAREPQR